MGYTLPSPDSPAERARALMARKDALEAELEAQGSILKANNTDMRQPLVDHDGFPRADLDVWAVRHARVRVIELRNDLTTLMDEMAKTLETIYPRSRPEPPQAENDGTIAAPGTEGTLAELLPFARVNGVAPGSPAADAGMERGDLVVKFGELRHPQSNLQAVATLVADNENKAISVLVRRLGVERVTALRLIPRQGWGGRGSLGWSIFPLNCL
ncbi:hypothetical protein B0F90DRAFT_1626023 [Multifurca ochricompacta]|uniref:Probable 26S proteasome regulatory subunit p27 n=1 Tax=Multifurca ochricompacta TaxID=376703 RepID=A0AAD4QQC4_9AGAM|nr:hypothetical protein B0F90DRAFT_1626023 [Multifurca ochricompacta]